jgi:4-hydroxyphenylacetate 3-monooxygenase
MRPEDFIADRSRPFTGAEYMESLRDGREVYFNGERVTDITAHPAFRNSVRSIARLYDALHDPKTRDSLTCPTDTGSSGYTHKFFRVARSRDDMRGAQQAIAGWARLSYGWMGRTPDYKAAFSNTLGGFPEYYGAYADNARVWYKRAQEAMPFMNHAIVNPPIDRHRPAEAVKDVYACVRKETDAGIFVSGAKVVATSAAMTHYNFMGQSSKTATEDPDLSVMFMVPINAPGLKLICRSSYEYAAARSGSPFDYPLSSRFDENDAIFIMDNVFIPWEDVFIYRDPTRVMSFFPSSGFVHGAMFQGCTRYAVKLDFISGLLAKALRATGGDEARNNQVLLGEVIAWRHLFWSLSNAMANNPQSWRGDAVLPDLTAAHAYRVFGPESWPRIRDIVQKTVTSALIYLPSSVRDFANPEIDEQLRRYVRGSHDIGHIERIKIMKLLWEAVGTEFAGRHELYERNYSGGWEDVRAQVLTGAQRGNGLREMEAMVEQCMAEYDINGWTDPTWVNP